MRTNSRIREGLPAVDVIIYFIAGVAAFITVWPFIYIISMSVSDPVEAVKQTVWLYPKGFSADAYEKIVGNSYLWRSYANTVLYVVSNTFLCCFTSVLGAYPLTKKGLYGRKFIIFYLLIPMYFGGGLVPYFILVNKMGLYNNPLVMIIPGMVSMWNIILVRTYFKTLPDSLNESAVIDGASDLQILFKIMVPLAKPIIAVIALYTAVGVWNSWFEALIFLPDKNWHPLQLFLAKVLIYESGDIKSGQSFQDSLERFKAVATAIQLKYAVIVFSSLPIICSYPFLQKYFLKGALLGSLKE